MKEELGLGIDWNNLLLGCGFGRDIVISSEN